LLSDRTWIEDFISHEPVVNVGSAITSPKSPGLARTAEDNQSSPDKDVSGTALDKEPSQVERTISTTSTKNSQVEHKDPPPVMKKAFDRFDTNKSGILELPEIQEALKLLLGSEVPPDKFDAAVRKFDSDGTGSLDVYEFGALVEEVRTSAKAYVEETVVPCEGSVLGKNKKLPGQDRVFYFYNKKIVAFFVAFCIMGNFVVNILEKQIDPNHNNQKYGTFWYSADYVFNIIFLVELWLNMWSYGGPVRRFWASGWNVFDTIIVTVGILTMVNVLRPPLDKLKLMRAFRVFRLFKRIESLNTIIIALLKSVPGVINAFVVMLVFYCIYAILAVELFRDFGKGGIYHTYDSITGSKATNDAYSARGYVLGIEYYGDFMRAIYTLFQVMTGESWSEAVVRPLIFGLYENNAATVGIFFVSFIILTQIVLINVVVAVLLDNFVTSEPDLNAEVGADCHSRP